jgi:molybdopterin-guanine dinucleotide biosynthesis protein A
MTRPHRAGFVLAGGRSSRMGRDKALLPLGDATMLDHIARLVQGVAGRVTLIGPPERYAALGHAVIADKIENCGPLAGVYTALSVTDADWNLVVACDMPSVTAPLFEDLFRAAAASRADAVVPQSPAGLDPLCAVYHRRVAPLAAAAIDRKILKMHDFLSTLQVDFWPVADARALENINTPGEWIAR